MKLVPRWLAIKAAEHANLRARLLIVSLATVPVFGTIAMALTEEMTEDWFFDVWLLWAMFVVATWIAFYVLAAAVSSCHWILVAADPHERRLLHRGALAVLVLLLLTSTAAIHRYDVVECNFFRGTYSCVILDRWSGKPLQRDDVRPSEASRRRSDLAEDGASKWRI